VVDLTAPGGPSLVANVDLGTYGQTPTDLLIDGRTLYAIHSRGVVAIDIDDPSKPVTVGRWNAPPGQVLSGALGSGDIYVVHTEAGLIVLRPVDSPEPTGTPTHETVATPTATPSAAPTAWYSHVVFLPWASGR
jgi:hypothetical protein